MAWDRFTPEELERRRVASVEALAEHERVKWAAGYQETCDKLYWTRGQCCAGCDHWRSEAGLSGECSAAGIVSGQQVLASAGIWSSSYVPPPGFPFSRADFHCGKFRDDFDWSTLDAPYLRRIRAMVGNELKPKPRPPQD